MIGNKIKALLELRSKTTEDVCNNLNIINTAYYRKLKKNTFKTEELILIAELTNTQLAFIDENGKPLITFDKNDIMKKDTDN